MSLDFQRLKCQSQWFTFDPGAMGSFLLAIQLKIPQHPFDILSVGRGLICRRGWGSHSCFLQIYFLFHSEAGLCL